jgi:CBS domain-containing protein
MRVRDIMTANPACCTPDTPLIDVAKMLVSHDCGAVPVVNNLQSRKPMGVVTDRDIVCRTVAAGRNALTLQARDCMSTPCVTVAPEMDLEECYRTFETKRVRRLVVVDDQGLCSGIVAQADIVLKGKESKAAEVIREISRPSESSSAVSI